MVKFYPAFPQDFNGSLAEERVYHKLKELPERFRIFHSYHWSAKIHHRLRKEGEADFIIFDPQHGILVLEVKGGGIRIEEGIWWQRDAQGEKPLKDSPWYQTQNCAHFLRNLILKEAPQASLPIYSCLWFPDVAKPRHLNFPKEIPDYAVLYKEDLDKAQSLEVSFAEIWKKYESEFSFRKSIPAGFNQKLPLILLPTLHLQPVKNLSAEESDREYFRLTEEQFKILEFIEDQRKVAIGGGAGSGKTIIAKEQALRLAKQGEPTLFLVFNSALAEDLQTSITNANLKISTWSKLAYEHCERNSPDLVSQDFVNKICNEDYTIPFKNIVIDEAQDFDKSWIDALDWICELNEGKMSLFYDNRQKIQGDNDGHIEWVNRADSKLTINRNCRNTAKIATSAHAFLGEKPPRMLSNIEGSLPLWIETNSGETNFYQILELLKKQLEANYEPHEIALVTLGSLQNSILKSIRFIEPTINGTKRKIPISENRTVNEILKTTVRKFKGLEAQIVFITDLHWNSANSRKEASPEDTDKFQKTQDLQKKTLYTAFSRAKREVILISSRLPERVWWDQKEFEANEFREFFCQSYGLKR